LAAGTAQSQTQLDKQIANAYESFGKPIDLATLATQLGMSQANLQEALGPEAQQLAQENTSAGLSTTARLDQANTNAVRNIIQNLNKRGILHSGEAGYQLDQQNLGYRQAQSDAYQKLLGYLDQYQQGYLSTYNTNAGKMADAYSSAADRVQASNTGTAGVVANPDHQDASGAWVYKGTDGNFYNADGSPYSAPQAPAAASAAPAAVPGFRALGDFRAKLA
jgi:hypothetical protein